MFAVILLCLVAIGIAYLHHVNSAMCRVPDEARKLSPHRWTVDEIKTAYKKAVHDPVDVTKSLPPKQDRRYIVVGGSGLVGTWIIEHLLARGENPAAIRALDLQPPRRGLLDLGITFVSTNIVDKTAVQSAFSQPWSGAVADLPLTVFHNAAVIRPAERHKIFLAFSRKVNVEGTANVLNGAKSAGASCFISTSSGSVCMRCPDYWIAPWTKTPKHLVQVLSDANEPPKEHDQFFGTYAISKSEAEGIVRAADNLESNFRTGCIRPANGVYGVGSETSATLISMYLRMGGAPTWLAHVIQNFVNAENVSIAHLCYEQRLIEHTSSPSTLPNIGGQSFIVTDPNPAVTFGDIYLALTTLATTPIRFPFLPPLPMFMLSYLVEWYVLLRHFYLPWLPAATGDLNRLQPAVFSISNPHLIIDDSRAREVPEKGGLGYNPPFTSLEGVCKEVAHWNRQAAELGAAAIMGNVRPY
ncbi:putative 3-beta hydroxysteroid dehydrogenase/isomerase family protein [Aspergillus undulatus]|uniref:putative 3-beta hydroxysteroid dehydrogenase/isomerase family protein n=1 Tax=Aspergillus undulatus TaxID=1810928 RepID=UPI003CCD9A84